MKKGNLVIVKTVTVAHYADHRKATETVRYTLCRVASATKDGKVKSVQFPGGSVTKLDRFSRGMSVIAITRPRAAEKFVAAMEGTPFTFQWDAMAEFEKILDAYPVESPPAPAKRNSQRNASVKDGYIATARVTTHGGEHIHTRFEHVKGFVTYSDAVHTAHGLQAKLLAENPGAKALDVAVEPAPAYRKRKAQIAAASREDTARRRELQAIQYAAWLARRDGKHVPPNGCTPGLPVRVIVNYADVRSDGKYEKRAYSVEWRSGSNTLLTIDIPNWDFVLNPPVEETIPEEMPELLEAA